MSITICIHFINNFTLIVFLIKGILYPTLPYQVPLYNSKTKPKFPCIRSLLAKSVQGGFGGVNGAPFFFPQKKIGIKVKKK